MSDTYILFLVKLVEYISLKKYIVCVTINVDTPISKYLPRYSKNVSDTKVNTKAITTNIVSSLDFLLYPSFLSFIICKTKFDF